MIKNTFVRVIKPVGVFVCLFVRSFCSRRECVCVCLLRVCIARIVAVRDLNVVSACVRSHSLSEFYAYLSRRGFVLRAPHVRVQSTQSAASHRIASHHNDNNNKDDDLLAPMCVCIYCTKSFTTVGRKGIRFLFRNPAAEPYNSRALAREFVGATQKDLETPSGDPGRVFFSA